MAEQTTQGKRLHPLWIPFSLGKSIKEMIIPLIYFVILKSNSDSTFVKVGSLFVAAYLIYSLITNIFYWKNFRYTITDDDVKINEGRLKTKKRYIALERIQSVQQNTTFFHKLVGLTSLTILTGTSEDDNSTIKLEMITSQEAETVRAQIEKRHAEAKQTGETDIDEVAHVEEDPVKKHYTISKKEIIRATFTSFSFLAFIAVLFTIYIKIDDVYPLDDKFMHLYQSLSWLFIAGVIMLLLILSSLLGVVFNYFRFGKFKVHSNQERIFIEKGVFNTTQFTIPKAKINAIKINKSFIRRWVGIAEVELISAGSMDDAELQTNILFPFIPEKRAIKLIPEILPALQMDSDMIKMPRPAVWLNLLRTVFLGVLLSVLIILIFPQKWYFSFLALGVIAFLMLLSVLHGRYLQSGRFIQIRRGVFSSYLLLTTKKKVAELEVTQSWIQQKFGLASLVVSTRAKPIEVTTISDMPESMAFRYYKWYAEQ